jgi:hypothetical protein
MEVLTHMPNHNQPEVEKLRFAIIHIYDCWEAKGVLPDREGIPGAGPRDQAAYAQNLDDAIERAYALITSAKG